MSSLKTRIAMALFVALAACALHAQPAGRRRALLIGINDYTASHLGARPRTTPPRDLPNLKGAAHDVQRLQEMLVLLHGFDRRDIVTLVDQSATRNAILRTLDQHLVRTAAKGDVLFFYFAGHGSQARNSRSDEPDKLDETLVPADSRAGARDIRDKELRPLFNRILDRGARLTVLLDNCNSGSGARGLPSGARPRGVKPDSRDVADSTNYGPRPDERGALVLSAAQDSDAAWETRDEEGNFHGAFSWAWIRAMRDASAGEAAIDTFLRAEARLRSETPYQDPVIEGNAEALLRPFLGVRTDRRGDRTVIAIKDVRPDNTLTLQGGWANGLGVGSELRVFGDPRVTVPFTITAIHGLGESEASIEQGRAMPQKVGVGTLLEVVGWAAPPGRPLRVWTPRVGGTVKNVHAFARSLVTEAEKRDLRWIQDPTDVTPAYLLRRGAHDWELLGPGGVVERIGNDSAAIAALSRIPRGSSLFAQFAATTSMLDGIAVGPGTDREGIVLAIGPEEADYILVGRYSNRRLEWCWMRPAVRSDNRRRTGLPLSTKWILEDGRDDTLRDSAPDLRDAVLRLRRIHAWQNLPSPPEGRFAYRLSLRRARDRQFVARDDAVIGDDVYELVLRAASAPPAQRVPPRYVYVFVIDSTGKSVKLFPENGSVENRLPSKPPPPPDIPLGNAGSFEIAPPYGVDTYFLLTTDEPLPNPWILEWDGVRTRSPATPTALERVLLLVDDATRSPIVTRQTWSIERVLFKSVRPRASPRSAQP